MDGRTVERTIDKRTNVIRSATSGGVHGHIRGQRTLYNSMGPDPSSVGLNTVNVRGSGFVSGRGETNRRTSAG